jgi:Holliday junction resolvasome RuvABC endonuclease subunit
MAKLKLEDIKQELIKSSWLLLSNSYDNLDTELEMQCPDGHRVFMSLRAWRRKKLCPVCDKNKFKKMVNTSAQPKEHKNHKRTLSLDASTNLTGWAIFDNDKLIGYGKISATKKTTTEKIAVINEWLMSMIDQWDPDVIVIEDIQQQVNHKTFKLLARLQGVLLNTIYINDIKEFLITSSAWRSGIGVRGRTREEMKKAAQAKVFEWYEIKVGDDEADAICMGRHLIVNQLKTDFYSWDV